MSGVKITEDTIVADLLELCPECREILMRYGLTRLVEEGIEDVVSDKLSLRGLCRLMDLGDTECMKMVEEIQNFYNKKLEDRL